MISRSLENYSWKNALLWGNFIEHCKKTQEGPLCNRFTHLLIAAAEFLPIIGQIASILDRFMAIQQIKTEEAEAAIKIQSFYRMHVAKRKFGALKAAVKIQSASRGFLAKKHLKEQKQAAIKIQSAFRGSLAKKHLKEQKAAIKIQSAVRGFLGKKFYKKIQDYLTYFKSIPANPVLDWRDRPKKIQQKIDEAFQSLCQQEKSNWGLFNGCEEYGMLSIPEHTLVKEIIQKAPKSQKEFYCLEIGSGNFQWERSVVKYLNSQTDIPEDITVHVIGIRGEGGKSVRGEIDGKCKLYELTAFKIENLIDEFQKNGLFLEKKVDFAISRWCLRHLVDPLGTFVQIYNLLALEGLFIGDGFYSLDKNQLPGQLIKSFAPLKKFQDPNEKHNGYNDAMIDLLIKTKAPFLMQNHDLARSLNRFIIKRVSEDPCLLNMNYYGLTRNLGYDIGSSSMTIFDKGEEKYTRDYFRKRNYECLYGDKNLFEWLRKNHLIDFHRGWGIKATDLPSIEFKLHQAIKEGNTKSIEELLMAGVDIDESNWEGYTPLHFAIINNQYESFKFLLEKGADKTLPSFDTQDKIFPLHFSSLLQEAETKKYEEKYIQLLK